MSEWSRLVIAPEATVREAIQRIEAGAMQIALVVDAQKKLLGTISDGDVRRAILRGVSLDARCEVVMNTSPTVARPGEDRDALLATMRARQLHRIPVLDGEDEEFQLVHEDDVVSALIALVDAKEGGPFNLAGDGTMTWRQSAEMIDLKCRTVSLKNMKRFNAAMWRLRVPNTDAPPGNLNFVRYPWVVSTEKLKATTGWKPKYDTLETFKITMRAKGKLPAEPSVEQPKQPVSST